MKRLMMSLIILHSAFCILPSAHAQCGPRSVGAGNVALGCASGNCGATNVSIARSRSVTRSFAAESVAPTAAITARSSARTTSRASSTARLPAKRLYVIVPAERLALSADAPRTEAHTSAGGAESHAESSSDPGAEALTLPEVALLDDRQAVSSSCSGGNCGGRRLRLLGGRRSVSRSVSVSVSR